MPVLSTNARVGTLRRSFATRLRCKKVDLKGVQNAGDWASFNSVLRYQHVNVDDQREILELIGTQRPRSNGP